jgi:hypothetical protein
MEPGPACPAGKTAGSRRWALQALGLLGVSAAELVLFWASARRHYAWVYPRWFDQLQYLREAYGSYDRMGAGGFAEGASQALGTASPQGSLHGFLGMVAFSIGGPSRTSALAVNLGAFLCLQAATFAAVRRISGSFAWAWAAVGLLAALQSPWSGNPGSAIDFRLDWMAACAYGVALAAAVCADRFRSTRWALLFGIAVGIALLVRHLTAIYFGLVYLGLLAWLLCQPDRLRRCGRLALSGLCALGVSGWAFWRSGRNIYTYYWIGHFFGAERALRDTHMNALSSLGWLLSELLFHQIGLAAALLGAAAGAAFLASGLRGGEREGPAGPRRSPGPAAWAAVLAFLAAPAAVMLIHPEKAPQPLNIMLPSATWVIVLVWQCLARRAARGAVAATCVAVALAGAALFVRSQLRDPFTPEMESEYRRMNAFSDYLYFRAEESGLSRPSVAVTRVFDGLNAGSFEVLGRERHRTPLAFIPTLPNGLADDPPGDVIARLAASDFVCLVTRGPRAWSFDREMEAMLPDLRDWCDRNLRHDGDLETSEVSVSLYERRALTRPAGKGVDLAAMIAAASRGPADAPVTVPGPPLLTTPATVLWTTQAEFDYEARAAYSPVRFHALAMPAGLTLDPSTGEIRGHFPAAGRFGAVLAADNAAGSARAAVTFLVTDQPWDGSVRPPDRATIGVPADFSYAAFDSRGTLDFIDVSDLTTGKMIARLPAKDDERRNWQGAVEVTFREPGPHRVKLRFVRYDPAAGGSYSFFDRECLVAAGP